MPSHLFVNLFRRSLVSAMRTRSMCTESKYEVLHDAESSKFFIKLSLDDEAKLEYNYHGNVMDMYHTEVPPSHQGKGIAAVLAQAAFKYAVENKTKMHLSCSYLQKYYREHPNEEYRTLVV